jgi:drug/metabolite transporter (DMT)-like permease
VAVILSVTALKEPITAWQIVGGVLILGFSLLNEIEWEKKEHNIHTKGEGR